MTPNEIESVKESINFLTRTMMAYIAGVYLLAGAVGKFVMEWLAHGELVWSNLGIIPTVTVVAAVVMSLEVFRLQWKIKRFIKQIGGTP